MENCKVYGAVDIRLFLLVCVVRQRSLSQADHSYRGVLPSVVCLCDGEASIMMKSWLTGGCCATEKRNTSYNPKASIENPQP